MLSMSLGDRKLTLSTGTPSTTYRGSFEPLKEVVPRTLTVIPPPGAPVGCCTATPAALPWMACAAEMMGRFSSASSPMVDTAVVRSLRLTAP